MKHILMVPILLILALHQATAQGERSERAYIGLSIQKDALARSLSGALVEKIDNNGPAKAAGIEFGDLIVRFDEKK
jgi:S1-C subfamily serine protease